MQEYGMASVHCLYMSYLRNSCGITRIESLFVINPLHPAGGLYNDISSPTPSHICFSTSFMHVLGQRPYLHCRTLHLWEKKEWCGFLIIENYDTLRSRNEVSQSMFWDRDPGPGAIPRVRIRIRSWLVSGTKSLCSGYFWGDTGLGLM